MTEKLIQLEWDHEYPNLLKLTVGSESVLINPEEELPFNWQKIIIVGVCTDCNKVFIDSGLRNNCSCPKCDGTNYMFYNLEE